jgi:hypothetical protein
MGNLLIYSATVDTSCIWLRALPRCRPCRASHGHKPIRRGRCAWSSRSMAIGLHASLPLHLRKDLAWNFVDDDKPNDASDTSAGLANNLGHGTGTLSSMVAAAW